MTKVKKVAGIDISKKFFDVCMIVEGKQSSKRFSNDHSGIEAVSAWLVTGVHCVMEVTGSYYLRLAVGLHQKGFTVSVVNPLVIKRFSQMRLLRAKTDKADAAMIAAYGLSEDLQCWNPPTDYIIKLQQLDAISDQLQKQHTALVNQMEAFNATGMMDKEVKDILLRAIRQLKKQIGQIDQKITDLIETHYAEIADLLKSIPGVGKKTASVLIVLTDGFTKFTSHKQLSAYVGLSPRIFESGSSVKAKARICKMGMSRIRALLYVCAWSAKRCNKACKELYERLVAKGKAKKLALIAVANKLIKQAFSIAMSHVPYNPCYQKNICL